MLSGRDFIIFFSLYGPAAAATTHLVMVPVGEGGWDLQQQRALVHGEVEAAAMLLHRHLVPLLVVQQAPQGHPVVAGRRGTCSAWSCNRQKQHRQSLTNSCRDQLTILLDTR